MENILFIALVAIVGLVRWFTQVAENKRNAEAEKQAGTPAAPVSAAPSRRAGPQTEEESVRKFLEALGVPASSPPPPKVQPAPKQPAAPKPAPRPKIMPVDSFPAPRGRRVDPRPPVAAPPLPPPVYTPSAFPPAEPTRRKRARVAEAASSAFEVQDLGAALHPRKTEAANAALVARLATPQGLRDAIVLREIFGPPRSMQPRDVIG